MKKTRIAVAQMCSTPDPEHNFKKIEKWIRKASTQGAELIAFPENFAILSENRSQLAAFADELTAPALKQLGSWSKENRIAILAGSMPTRRGRKFGNTTFYIDTKGKTQARYQKIHLFDADVGRRYRESATFEPGKQVVSLKTPRAHLGFTICYDLRFPELYRKLSAKGANVLFAPSAFTVPTGKAHWDTLTRSRAVENLSYLVAPAQTGEHYRGRKTYGHSRVVDPWGQVIAEKRSGEGLIFASWDPAQLAVFREKMPSLKHRRLR